MLFVLQFTIHNSEFIINERRIVACSQRVKRNLGESRENKLVVAGDLKKAEYGV